MSLAITEIQVIQDSKLQTDEIGIVTTLREFHTTFILVSYKNFNNVTVELFNE